MVERDLATLVERARRIQMTPAEREEQRRSFAYGNANIENPSVTREVVEKAAAELADSRPPQKGPNP